MSPLCKMFSSSLGKKYVMALTGIILCLFILGHLGGNLLIFLPPDNINAYALHLHSIGPAIWLIRAFLLAVIGAHIYTGVKLALENKAARPVNYGVKNAIQSTIGSRSMPVTGCMILAFVVFHILQFTVQKVGLSEGVPGMTTLPGVAEPVTNVHGMLVDGFSRPAVSIFYIIAMALLALHVSHGASSMFQSLGLRNDTWRKRLDIAAKGFAAIIFIGFASIPAAVLAKVVTADTTAGAAPIINLSK